MGTRAVFTISDNSGSYHLYVHSDGHFSGACDYITDTLKMSWLLPRFEADEFAAAMIAANKTGGGGLRITSSPNNHHDLDYTYVIEQADNGQLIIRAESTDGNEKFYGRVKDFIASYGGNLSIRTWNELVPSKNPIPLKEDV